MRYWKAIMELTSLDHAEKNQLQNSKEQKINI